jgi:hypothetical protein
MSNLLRKPTLVQTGRALIAAVVADVGNAGGIINSVLPSGVTLSLETSTNDASSSGDPKYKKIKFGSRGIYPDGLALQLYPANMDNAQAYAPYGKRVTHAWDVVWTWNAPPDNLNPDSLTELFCNLSETLDLVIGPSALSPTPGTPTGGWNPLGDGLDEHYLLNPFISTVIPLAFIFDPKVAQHQFIVYSRSLWGAFREFPDTQ